MYIKENNFFNMALLVVNKSVSYEFCDDRAILT